MNMLTMMMDYNNRCMIEAKLTRCVGAEVTAEATLAGPGWTSIISSHQSRLDIKHLEKTCSRGLILMRRYQWQCRQTDF